MFKHFDSKKHFSRRWYYVVFICLCGSYWLYFDAAQQMATLTMLEEEQQQLSMQRQDNAASQHSLRQTPMEANQVVLNLLQFAQTHDLLIESASRVADKVLRLTMVGDIASLARFADSMISVRLRLNPQGKLMGEMDLSLMQSFHAEPKTSASAALFCQTPLIFTVATTSQNVQLKTLRFVGYLHTTQHDFALLASNEAQTFLVMVGDHIGKEQGVVAIIKHNYLQINLPQQAPYIIEKEN